MKRLEYEFSRKESSSSFETIGDSSDEQPNVSRRRLDENSFEKSLNKPNIRTYYRTNFPRLRWSNELHQIFNNVVESLGGVERATPKMVLQMMNVKGVTISHIKSRLQVCRSMKKEQNPKDGERVEVAETNNSGSHDDGDEQLEEVVVEVINDQLNAKDEPLITTLMPNSDNHKDTATQDRITSTTHNYQQEDSEYKGEENGVDGSSVVSALVFKDFFNTGVTFKFNGGHEGLASSSFGRDMESNVSLELTLG